MNSNNFNHQNKSDYYKITLTISEDLDELLMKIGNTARAQRGYKLPKTLIIRSLIRLLYEIDVNVEEVKTEEEFYKRLKQALFLRKNK